MPCYVPRCALTRVWQRGYKSDPGVDHWTTVKIVLRNKEMFLDYGGDEEFGVKGYVDASLNTYLDDSEWQTGYI